MAGSGGGAAKGWALTAVIVSDAGLVLEAFTPHDFATLASWFTSEREVVQWGGPAVHHPLTAEQMREMLPDAHQPPSRLAWMALRGASRLGHAQVISIDHSRGTARLGRIVIAPAYRGQGLAVPMLQLVIARTMAIAAVQRIDLGVYVWNAGAVKTYERSGFVAGDITPDAVTVDGEAWDLQEMSLHTR
jgi:RimJ/RimL family protein N-acetyltransferase